MTTYSSWITSHATTPSTPRMSSTRHAHAPAMTIPGGTVSATVRATGWTESMSGSAGGSAARAAAAARARERWPKIMLGV